jgi:uncharacterized protein YaiE (UPF0345 family)
MTQNATQFDNVSVIKRANTYFDGKCVSHTVLFPDGTRKTLGVIFPATLQFGTDAPEIMELTGDAAASARRRDRMAGICRGPAVFRAGQQQFDIEVVETLDYVCHYG